MKQIGFIAAGDGSVVKYDASLHAAKSKANPLGRHQRATLYFKAMRCVSGLLKEVGFRSLCQDSTAAITLEMGNNGREFILELTAQVPPPMAHVTSYPGYVYDPNKVAAKVTSVGVSDSGEYVIRVVAMLSNMKTQLPIYVVVEKDSVDPLREAFMGILTSVRELVGKDPTVLSKIQEAMASRNLEADFKRFRENVEKDELNLPPSPRR